MPSSTAAIALRQLLHCANEFGQGCGTRKHALLRTLEKQALPKAINVVRLHDTLCFLRAYPDDAVTLRQVERMMTVFSARNDVKKYRRALVDTGIAGTQINFRFFAVTAHWLARRWGQHLTIDWEEFEHRDQLELWLTSMTLYCETPGLDAYAFDVHEWIERLKGPGETDARFLLRRFERMPMKPRASEILLEDLDVPLCLHPGPNTPARTREKYAGVPIVYQTRPLSRIRPSVQEIIERKPAVRALSTREGHKIVDLARAAMATRSRDLDAFAYASKHDVQLIDCADGLHIALIGLSPERRLFLETLYGFLVLKNGVPVGYGTLTGLFNSAEIAYTIFDNFRSGEAAAMVGWVLTVASRLLEADTIVVDPYQIGQDNEDAIRSGAWWFYQKLGFRPRKRAALQVMRKELKRMQVNPSHRSSVRTLTKLAEHNMFLNLNGLRDDVLGILPLADVGLRVSEYLASRFGSKREAAVDTCRAEALELLNVRSYRRFSPAERLAWSWWAPLVMCIPNIARWRNIDKRALAALIRAKAGRSEMTYLRRFNTHKRLRNALQQLATHGAR